MNNTNTGGPAFPQNTLEPKKNGGEPLIVWQSGMTLRDYFAAKAMQGLLAGELTTTKMSVIASECYAMADAMLAARSAT